jgi:hypothetical protein
MLYIKVLKCGSHQPQQHGAVISTQQVATCVAAHSSKRKWCLTVCGFQQDIGLPGAVRIRGACSDCSSGSGTVDRLCSMCCVSAEAAYLTALCFQCPRRCTPVC